MIFSSQVLRNYGNIHSGAQILKNFFHIMSEDFDLVKGFFGHEGFDEYPSCICETAGIDDNQSMLSLWTIIK